MNKKTSRPNWSVLYLVMAIFLVALFGEAKMPVSENGHTWAQVGLVMLFYGLVGRWLMANEVALTRKDREELKHYDRWIPTRPDPYLSGRPVIAPKNDPLPDRAVSGITGWAAPAWLSAAWSFLVGLVHRLS